jgi:acyl transferase domain-containing protein
VTGEPIEAADAGYWVSNVRKPVQFKDAVERVFTTGLATNMVLEVTPHRTLAGPVTQTLQPLQLDDPVPVVSTLNRRKESCTVALLEAASALFEKGTELELAPIFGDRLRFTFCEDLPGHPAIKVPFHEDMTVLNDKMNAQKMNYGPALGHKSPFSNTFMHEVSERTCKSLMGHCIGGEVLVPGGYFTEMAAEAIGLPATITNVEFK